MGIKLEQAIPFGRSLEEYKMMFDLSEMELSNNIVSIADGPASFNSEMWDIGKTVTSIDPIYIFSAQEIKNQFYKAVDDVVKQVKDSPEDWVWNYHKSPDDLKKRRISVIKKFLNDYEIGKSTKRYIVGELPRLDTESDTFDIALIAHFLFLYSEQYSYEFHKESIYEALRVAKEVRIFPLLTLACKKSIYVDPLVKELAADGFDVSIKKVGYELQRNGNEMLTIKR